jgi:hypothetical protein
MAGNFSQVLWKGISGRFDQQFDLPAGSLHPYLSRVAGNFIEAPDAALTGPLIRNDQQTIEKNIQSLNGDPLQDLYRAFVRFYQSDPGQTQIEQAKMEQVS